MRRDDPYDSRNPVQMRSSSRTGLWFGLAAVVLVAFVAGASELLRDRDGDHPGASRSVARRGDLTDSEVNRIDIFRRAAPSVVGVSSAAVRRGWTNGLVEIPKGAGTGIVWDEYGHIVTNQHVVDGGQRFEVLFVGEPEGRPAELWGEAPEYDLAVLKVAVEPELLDPIAIGSSHDLQVGQSVLAIGNPFGLSHTLTSGIVSALNRQLRARSRRWIESVIQIDAAINPGNSGGPLLDSSGRLIGVNSAIYSTNEGDGRLHTGIGFAVPVDTVNWVVPMLIRERRIVRPSLGVTVYTPSPGATTRQSGVYVVDVLAGGPADKAGLRGEHVEGDGQFVRRHGDVITHVGQRPVTTYDELYAALERYHEGDEVALRVIRDGQPIDIAVELAPPIRSESTSR